MFTLVLSGYVLMYFPHHDISFDGNWFLRIMVPPIVFEAALSIDKRSFNRHIVPIVIFSVVGTLTATVVTAYVVHRGTTALSRYCTPIPAVEALTFGALISSIDPIAVLSVLSNMGMTDTDTIYVLIFGESVRTRHESACLGVRLCEWLTPIQTHFLAVHDA
jgi:NhaP-type Na+/H+ or K+/H+ antiporter